MVGAHAETGSKAAQKQKVQATKNKMSAAFIFDMMQISLESSCLYTQNFRSTFHWPQMFCLLAYDTFVFVHRNFLRKENITKKDNTKSRGKLYSKNCE